MGELSCSITISQLPIAVDRGVPDHRCPEQTLTLARPSNGLRGRWCVTRAHG